MHPLHHFPQSELEEKLTSPQGAVIKEKYLSRLRTLEIRIQAYLKAGPCQVQYASSQALANAVETAIIIMKNYPTTKPVVDTTVLSPSANTTPLFR